jgi:hypothetical protein
MGNDNRVVVSYKFSDFQGCVGGHIVVMEPVVVAPKFWSFSSQSELTVVLGGINSQ